MTLWSDRSRVDGGRCSAVAPADQNDSRSMKPSHTPQDDVATAFNEEIHLSRHAHTAGDTRRFSAQLPARAIQATFPGEIDAEDG